MEKSVNKLQNYRIKKGLTRAELADELNVATHYIYMIETGIRTPGFKFSKRIADYFETTIEDIFFSESEVKTWYLKLL